MAFGNIFSTFSTYSSLLPPERRPRFSPSTTKSWYKSHTALLLPLLKESARHYSIQDGTKFILKSSCGAFFTSLRVSNGYVNNLWIDLLASYLLHFILPLETGSFFSDHLNREKLKNFNFLKETLRNPQLLLSDSQRFLLLLHRNRLIEAVSLKDMRFWTMLFKKLISPPHPFSSVSVSPSKWLCKIKAAKLIIAQTPSLPHKASQQLPGTCFTASQLYSYFTHIQSKELAKDIRLEQGRAQRWWQKGNRALPSSSSLTSP